ncbi:hypothetical protein LCGC14_1719430 [marine sediment metagenome]|uniref:Uncharacterized protein n=1 Tax=marine sediment metagenome TaxID=412755 RepID=A0A0F9HD63_9ZZZZ
MPASDLTPNQLRRLLAALEVSKALVLDAIRGRSVRREDVADLRRTVIGVRRVLNALDEERPWQPPEPPPAPPPE